MDESKKKIEDAVWNYIAQRRPLKIAAILISALGIIDGAIGALEKPYRYVEGRVEYALGLKPAPQSVVLERNAFIAGILLVENYHNCGTSDHGPMKPSQENFDAIESAFRALGYTDPQFHEVRKKVNDECREAIRLTQQYVSGYLESKSLTAQDFFNIGNRLTALRFAALRSDVEAVARLDAELRAVYSRTKRRFPQRLPSLPLMDPQYFVSSDSNYNKSAAASEDAIRIFLGVGDPIDPMRRQRTLN